MKTALLMSLALAAALGVVACASPGDPGDGALTTPVDDGSMRVAALDYSIGNLSDPDELAKFSRAEIVIVQPWQFWNQDKALAPLRAANPDIKILAYFRSKAIRSEWAVPPESGRLYTYDLFQAAAPYLARTTTGDTVSDWPGALVVDYTNPAAREAMIEVFADYQATSINRFDGIFWDYFSRHLWISPEVTTMEGAPDMDQDGVPHEEDEDEQQAFLDGQDAWVDEMQAAMGYRFIQMANGERALRDSTFAANLDGMFYEMFPGTTFGVPGRFRGALDPQQPFNLCTARNWPRRRNGGPWLVLSQMRDVGSFVTSSGQLEIIDGDLLTGAMALMTGATAITYDGSGTRSAGIPAIEYDLGAPLGGMVIDGDLYTRDYANGRLEIFMGSGDYPTPFDFRVIQNGVVIQDIDFPNVIR